MNAKNIVVALVFLVTGCAFELDNAMEMDGQGNPGGSTWLEYQKKGIPSVQEQLALEVVKSGGKRQEKGDMSAWMKEDDPPFAVVAVDEKGAKGDQMTRRTLYRFEEETITEYSHPEFVETVALEENKVNREKYAREVAMQAKERRLPLMPVMYERKYAYSPKYDGGCSVIVTEKNSQMKVIGSYSVNVCQGGQ